MKTILAAIFIAASLLIAYPAVGQSTQPAELPLAFRANQAFSQGRYAAALPLLQELAGTLIDQPDQVGPVEERIRVCKKAIAAALTTPHDPTLDPPPPMAADTRVPHPPPVPGEVLEMPIKQLGNFEYDAEHGGNIPKDVVRLSGATLRMRGFMVPIDQADNITEFALVPSLFACCFGQPPQIQHTIVVHLPAGKAVSYYPGELQVEGTLTVDERKDEGYIVSIFDLDATTVNPAPR